VGITWKDGKLQEASVKNVLGTGITVRYGSTTADLKIQPGQTVRLNTDLQPVR